jgi:hypothetical protein
MMEEKIKGIIGAIHFTDGDYYQVRKDNLIKIWKEAQKELVERQIKLIIAGCDSEKSEFGRLDEDSIIEILKSSDNGEKNQTNLEQIREGIKKIQKTKGNDWTPELPILKE